MKNCYTVITYNNYGNPFLSLKTYHKEGSKEEFVKEDYIEFDKSSLNNGLPLDKSVVSDFIKDCLLEKNDFYLVLNCQQIFKINSVMPLIAFSKAKKLVEDDIKANYPNIEYEFYKKQSVYKNDIGYIFYDYVIPKTLVEYFDSALKPFKKKIKKYEIYSTFLLKTNNLKEREYIYVYQEHNNYTLVLKFDGVNSYITDVINLEKLEKNYLKIASKHQSELEKRTLTKCYSNVVLKDFSIESKKIDVLNSNIDTRGF